MTSPAIRDLRNLPRTVSGRRASVWLGMLLFIVIEATVIASLLTSYFYFRVMAREGWPPPGIATPDLVKPSVSLLLLLVSIVPAFWASGSLRKNRSRRFHLAMSLAIALLVGYAAASFYDLSTLAYGWSHHVYGSLVWLLSSYQLLHVIGLFGLAGGVLFLGTRRRSRVPTDTGLQVVLLYWAFVVVASLPTYATLYLTPHFLP